MQTDEELAQGVQRGNRDDLAVLVERHHSPLLGFLYRMTGGDRALAEDLVQESLVRLLRGIHQYVYPRPFKPWLYQIATNLTRDHYKRADTRHTESMPEDALSLGAADEPQPEAALLLRSEARQVAAAIRELPEHQREVVIFRYYQEFSLAEIADALNIPVGTVKSRLSIGLKRLRIVWLEQEREL
ncbi:MAG: RNA polymerase sigma factor [Anaerolineaceae bacterium]|nr:RNA polymerase sigma factor [Anaerolineaceae bacterium]